MDTGISGGSGTTPAKVLKPHHQTQLHTAVRKIVAGLVGPNMGIARHHQLVVYARQLRELTIELGAGEAVTVRSAAVENAIQCRATETARLACITFEHAVDAVSEGVPQAREPMPIEVAPIANPANDNDEAREREPNVPERGQDAPEQDQPTRVIDAPAPALAPATSAVAPEVEPSPAAPIEAANDAPAANDSGEAVATSETIGQLGSVAELGEVLRQARTRRQLTQQDVATAAGVGRRFVAELEGGKATSQIGCVLAVCSALGISLAANAA